MEYKEKAELLDLLQRKASLLIQGVSFWISLQRELELRDKLIEQYKLVLDEISKVEI